MCKEQKTKKKQSSAIQWRDDDELISNYGYIFVVVCL